ncbi:hypothetical protein M1M25_gp071 [Tenacibaculum phage Gundel_1]|uniref:N-acetyltransferase domain-containing protein n=1 Tax=Tenacibaculum phage Gundel_1 TaxID=2745672 RepID=A0A8E4ZDZ7_9CAUD|nr:hypothetical protein M1M25_gp071 [Tenacibaculum phage Gundel_1]QQV91507.1 hypothetical protein Gundel1_71 [Tenacibaculum phage Gundel_1]
MEYTLRHLTEEDYKMLAEWWKLWRWTPVPRVALPDNMEDGILISVNGEPACAGFLYSTSASKVFIMEFIISNPKIKDKEARKKVVDYTIKSIIELAKKAGAVTILSWIKNEHLINKYLDNGFIYGDKNMTNMVYNF